MAPMAPKSRPVGLVGHADTADLYFSDHAMRFINDPSISRKTLFILGLFLFTACATQPSKYRKKKGCDCPKWNMAKPVAGSPVHAKFDAPEPDPA